MVAKKNRDALDVDGSLAIAKGTVGLPAPLGLITDISAKAEIHDQQLVANAAARARGGRVEISATTALDGLAPRTAEVRVETHKWPVNLNGSTVWATANADVSLTRAAGWDVTVKEGNLVMPSFGTNKNVMCYLDDIYVYLKAVGSGAIPRGRPAEQTGRCSSPPGRGRIQTGRTTGRMRLPGAAHQNEAE